MTAITDRRDGRSRADDLWQIDTVDVDAYLARIGQSRQAPSAAALRDLARAHVLAIPFENIDIVLGRHRGIGLDAVTAKLVGRQRGGYCYEHGGLFAAVAERLGYRVVRTAARVRPREGGPYTHMALVVEADGIEHLVDVGFGMGILAPMPLVDGAVVDQAGWPHRLVLRNDWWTLRRFDGARWTDLHEFLPAVHSQPIDYEVFDHFTSTHPRSPFTGRLVAMRAADGLFRRLLGRELTHQRPDGTSETRTVDPAELDDVLRDLDVVLTPDELAALLTNY